jgi:hypothetical protein
MKVLLPDDPDFDKKLAEQNEALDVIRVRINRDGNYSVACGVAFTVLAKNGVDVKGVVNRMIDEALRALVKVN